MIFFFFNLRDYLRVLTEFLEFKSYDLVDLTDQGTITIL